MLQILHRSEQQVCVVTESQKQQLPKPEQETHNAHLPQQVQCHYHLERGRPDHVYISSQVHESLSIHRHQIHNLTHSRSLPSRICDNKCLCVDKK